MTEPPAPALPPEVLERMRTIGLRIDRHGRLWHQADEVTHAGLKRAILRWLDVRADGRPIVRLDDVRYAYVDVDDTPLRVTAVRWDGDVPIALLDDGTSAPLALPTLAVDPDDRLRCRVRDGRLAARLTSAAHQVLLERAAERAGVYGVEAAGAFWPLVADVRE
ncbi:MAG: hypothetical protein IPL61_35525 [Myxococcales bacterium]|nr:hypothetical protein [Myxococcales bacterium]